MVGDSDHTTLSAIPHLVMPCVLARGALETFHGDAVDLDSSLGMDMSSVDMSVCRGGPVLWILARHYAGELDHLGLVAVGCAYENLAPAPPPVPAGTVIDGHAPVPPVVHGQGKAQSYCALLIMVARQDADQYPLVFLQGEVYRL